MTVSNARVQLVNRALLKLGMPATYTIDGEDNELGGIVDLVWPGVAARVVAIYDWSFCRKLFQPAQLADTPNNGWAYGFELPGERIGLPLAVLDQAGSRESYLRNFMIEGGCIYANTKPLWLRCRVMLDPDYWDEGFREAFCLALASALSVPLAQDEGLAEQFEVAAFGTRQEFGGGGLFGRLIALDRAAQPQGRGFMDNDPLTTARW